MSTTSGTNPVSAEPLQRLHALLVEAVRERRGADPHAAPVTVAEIYQELVPYRQVRAAIGLELNADYEHTLLRLLSGESQLARIEPMAAREQMQRELESPNPNVGLYRKFAGCDVWLLESTSPTPTWVAEHLAEAGDADGASAAPAESAPVARGVDRARRSITADWEPADVPPADEPPAAAEPSPQPEQPPAATTGPDSDSVAAPATRHVPLGTDAGHCAFCDSALPAGRPIRFCPFCGANQSQRPCTTCGEPLRQDWAFCIACGAVVAVPDA